MSFAQYEKAARRIREIQREEEMEALRIRLSWCTDPKKRAALRFQIEHMEGRI